MTQEGYLSACLCSDTEMHTNAEEGTSGTTQCYPIDTSVHANDECGSGNKLDDCCVSIISEENVFVSATEAIKMELPGNGMNPWLANFPVHLSAPEIDTVLLCIREKKQLPRLSG
jgi:hypothetical protein